MMMTLSHEVAEAMKSVEQRARRGEDPVIPLGFITRWRLSRLPRPLADKMVNDACPEGLVIRGSKPSLLFLCNN